MKSDKAASRKGVSAFFVVLPIILALLPVFFTLQAGDPLSFMLPNFLLFTNLRSLARSQWESLLKLNTAVHHTPHHVPIVSAEQYSYESLREATENFRYPAVVRGLFSNTPAARKWGEPGYLSSIIGDFSIPVINDAKIGKANATAQEGRTLMKFGDAYEVLPRILLYCFLFYRLVFSVLLFSTIFIQLCFACVGNFEQSGIYFIPLFPREVALLLQSQRGRCAGGTL